MLSGVSDDSTIPPTPFLFNQAERELLLYHILN
jgi:hypothetical protein